MTSDSHTPGPWKACSPADSYFDDLNIVRPDGLACAVAVMNGDIPRIEVAYNAFLIAAAPDLLAALEFVPLPGRSEEMIHFRERINNWLRVIRNPAVEKARAGQQ